MARARALAALAAVTCVVCACLLPGAHAQFTVSVYANATAAVDGLPLMWFTAQPGMVSGTYSMATEGIAGVLTLTDPADACSAAGRNPANATGTPWIALARRGSCSFRDKVYNVQTGGAIYALVYNNHADSVLVTMTGPVSASEPISIPSAFAALDSYTRLTVFLNEYGGEVYVVFGPLVTSGSTGGDDSTMGPYGPQPDDLIIFMFVPFLVVVLCSSVVFIVGRVHMRRQFHRRYPRPVVTVAPATMENYFKALPVVQITEADISDKDGLVTCAICLDDFVVGDQVKRLPCRHEFHTACLHPWLQRLNRVCPTCKQDIWMEPIAQRTPAPAVGGMVAIEMQDLATIHDGDDEHGDHDHHDDGGRAAGLASVEAGTALAGPAGPASSLTAPSVESSAASAGPASVEPASLAAAAPATPRTHAASPLESGPSMNLMSALSETLLLIVTER